MDTLDYNHPEYAKFLASKVLDAVHFYAGFIVPQGHEMNILSHFETLYSELEEIAFMGFEPIEGRNDDAMQIVWVFVMPFPTLTAELIGEAIAQYNAE